MVFLPGRAGWRRFAPALGFLYHPRAMSVTLAALVSHRVPYGRFWLVLLLLLAAGLRLAYLDQAPPGVTHDEADHGLDAWRVVQGERPIYFTTSNGREPLFDYATALLMAAAGRTFLAGRLTAAFFGLLFVASNYAWTRRAFGPTVALLGTAGLALGFWPVMVARQALRTVALPALLALALALAWRGWDRLLASPPAGGWTRRPLISGGGALLAAGLALGLSFYSYIPARVLWLLLPVAAVYLGLAGGPRTWPGRRRFWLFTILGLALALLIGWPLFRFLQLHPEAEVRITQLSAPLNQAAQGEWTTLLTQSRAALGLFTIRGDPAWRYNLPGRPLLPGSLGWLFYPGLLLALGAVVFGLAGPPIGPARRLGAGAIQAGAGLLLGLAPALITGPELSTTQAVGMMPFLYLFPALSLAALLAAGDRLPTLRAILWLMIGLLFLSLGWRTSRDYFQRWSQAPEVRVQYETSLVTALNYLNQAGGGAVALATPTPGPFHSQAVAALILRHPAVSPRWFRSPDALLVPASATGRLLFTGFAPLSRSLEPYLAQARLETILPLRPSDLDRPVEVYRIDGPAWLADVQGRFQAPESTVIIGDAVALLGHELHLSSGPENRLRLATLWQIQGPVAHELVQFTHLTGSDGTLLAQADRLDVASQSWWAGDAYIQWHDLPLPAGGPAGPYDLQIGLYHCPGDCAAPVRLAVRVDGQPAGDSYHLTTIAGWPAAGSGP